ncbi:hypothetical protein ACMYYO_01425 [Dermacoccaceae bacterium W4C1]
MDTALVTELLASPQFERARNQAPHLAGDAQRLRELLDQVDSKQFSGWKPGLADAARMNLDIACAVLEGRIEQLQEGHRDPAAEVVSAARLNVFVAVLLYVADAEDVIPDDLIDGHRDDLTLVHWAVNLAREQLPVME